MQTPRVWVLLGGRRGDNNQLLALAEALELPYETKLLRYNALRLLDKRLLGASVAVLDRASRRSLEGPLPDLVLAVGHRSVPVVRSLKRRSGGKLRAVHIGNPRVSPHLLDLVITTPQYPVPDGPKVLRLPISLSEPLTRSAKINWPRLMRLMAIGGPTTFWTVGSKALTDALRKLTAAAKRDGGSVVVSASPRTPPALLRKLHDEGGVQVARAGSATSFVDLLTAADEIFVTADSVAMISEAISTRKPVGLVPVLMTSTGRIVLRAADALGRPAFPRDIRRFWAEIDRLGLAGTVDAPRSGNVPDVLAQAASRVRALLERAG